MTAPATAGTTVALAALVALDAWTPSAVLAAAVLLAGLLLAAGWPALLALPTPRGTTGVVAGTAVASAVAVALATAVVPAAGLLSWAAPALAVALLVAFGHQLLRRDGRPRLVESVTAVVTGQALVIGAAAWVAVPHTAAGPALVVGGALAVAVSALLGATSWPLRVVGPASALLGAAAGWVGTLLGLAAGPGAAGIDDPAALAGLLVGLLAGVLTAVWRTLVAPLPALHSRRAALAVAAAPVALSGPCTYVLARVLLV